VLWSEESKVNQEPSHLPSSSLEKKAQAKACLFFHLVFKERGSSQAGENSLLRWFWSFTGTRGTAAARTSAALVVVSLSVLLRLPTSPPSIGDKSKVECRPSRARPPTLDTLGG